MIGRSEELCPIGACFGTWFIGHALGLGPWLDDKNYIFQWHWYFLRGKTVICNNIFELSGNSFPQLFCLNFISCALCEIFLLIIARSAYISFVDNAPCTILDRVLLRIALMFKLLNLKSDTTNLYP